MTIGTIGDIRTKIRKLSASGTSLQLTDADIDDYINSFYSYDLPAQFRSLKLKERYTFNTTRGVDTYAFDSENYTTLEMPCYVSKRPVQLFNDPWTFFSLNYNWQFQDDFATGTGGAGPYSGTLQNTPIIRSFNTNPVTNPRRISYVQNILITANVALGNTLNVTDDGSGNLIGNCVAGGSINYDTGAIANLTFTAAVPSGNEIQAQYNPATLSIPLSILFFQNNITLRPVPDRGYTVEMVAYRKPAQALTNANQYYPELTEWWELLAVGAAKKVYEDRLDFDGVALMDKMLRERYDVAETRTYCQLETQRTSTIYANQLQYGYGSSNNWFSG